jgi:hypothetical protein
MTPATLILALSLAAAPPLRKIDPEPPRRNPAGDWAGTWNRSPVTVHLDRNGHYHQTLDGLAYSGKWRRDNNHTDHVIINEWRVPGHDYDGSCTYCLYLSRDGKTLRTGVTGTTMRRVK